tara:strand:- start:14107 stop:14319 length:213 start_codon:yes stop_codon:yes gene_type:complete
MINLDARYHEYLKGHKKMRIDGINEKVRAFGYTDDGKDIVGYYVKTENYVLYFDLKEVFLHKEDLTKVSA